MAAYCFWVRPAASREGSLRAQRKRERSFAVFLCGLCALLSAYETADYKWRQTGFKVFKCYFAADAGRRRRGRRGKTFSAAKDHKERKEKENIPFRCFFVVFALFCRHTKLPTINGGKPVLNSSFAANAGRGSCRADEAQLIHPTPPRPCGSCRVDEAKRIHQGPSARAAYFQGRPKLIVSMKQPPPPPPPTAACTGASGGGFPPAAATTIVWAGNCVTLPAASTASTATVFSPAAREASKLQDVPDPVAACGGPLFTPCLTRIRELPLKTIRYDFEKSPVALHSAFRASCHHLPDANGRWRHPQGVVEFQ